MPAPLPALTPDSPPAMTLDALEAAIAAAAAGLCRRMASWLELVAEFDRRGAARRWGFPSTARWLAWRCGIGARAAREHVRVARRLDEMPAVRAAFAAGELSYSKLRALTRADPGEDEQALLGLARALTAERLEQRLRSLRSAPSGELEVAREAHRRRALEWWWDVDGSLRLAGRFAPDDGAALVEAVETAAEAMHERDVDGPRPTWRPPLGARRADALAEIAASGAPRARVVVHVDPASLGETCHLAHGPAVPPETARRLACDASVVIAAGTDADGADADHGRGRRLVSPALRRVLEQRDRGCRFPGCDRRHGLHAHHLRHWAHGGATDRDNLVLLCRHHHRLVHEDGFHVARERGELRFLRPDGVVIGDLPPPARVAA